MNINKLILIINYPKNSFYTHILTLILHSQARVLLSLTLTVLVKIYPLIMVTYDVLTLSHTNPLHHFTQTLHSFHFLPHYLIL